MGNEIYFKVIQLMLSPAIMISACGLLLLSINNKYSAINSRLRLLNDERRHYSTRISEDKELNFFETTRLQSITKQIDNLLYRLKLVRNVVLSYVVSLFLFIVTSIVIGLDIFLKTRTTDYIAMVTFVAGMISVGIGLIFSVRETIGGYKIIEVEIKSED